MNKLIISFKKGEYSTIKDKFKAIFAGKYKWDGKQAWVSKDGFVKATQKMESGQPIKLLVECDEKLKNKFIEFCNEYKIECETVESFDNVNVINVIEDKPKPAFSINVKIDRVKRFDAEFAEKHNMSCAFFEGWRKLLIADDERLNKILEDMKDE